MARTISVGRQDFETMRIKNNFYVDKTMFIKEWWEEDDDVTLITRPRRFGKTLNMSMLEKFFSAEFVGRDDLFKGLAVWEDEKYRALQGTYPVIFLTFAGIKENNFEEARRSMCRAIEEQYNKYDFLLKGDLLNENEKKFYQEVSMDMSDGTASASLRALSDYLGRYYGKRTIILLDEYDTPMQEAYVNGYWNEMVSFTRGMFNAAFKTNPYLERALMTGITRVSKESVFSDLNNLKVVTTTSEQYADCFGFTEEEVFAALDEFAMPDRRADVKRWYDGFTFGNKKDIYNPWSIINYLDSGKFRTYWANTSSNSLVGKLLQEGTKDVKLAFERLLSGEHLIMPVDEQIVYNMLDGDETAIWSLLLASGYLKVVGFEEQEEKGFGTCALMCELAITNYETKLMFAGMVRGWFARNLSAYNDFIKALLLNDIDAMNDYMNHVTRSVFSYFDTGKNPSKSEPERFYHGFVLGLMVELSDRYVITSNRESGFGRYDVMLEPKEQSDDAIILEFKVFQPRKEKDLADTVASALKQIEEKDYEAVLTSRGFAKEHIRRLGFAFCGSQVLIGENSNF